MAGCDAMFNEKIFICSGGTFGAFQKVFQVGDSSVAHRVRVLYRIRRAQVVLRVLPVGPQVLNVAHVAVVQGLVANVAQGVIVGVADQTLNLMLQVQQGKHEMCLVENRPESMVDVHRIQMVDL